MIRKGRNVIVKKCFLDRKGKIIIGEDTTIADGAIIISHTHAFREKGSWRKKPEKSHTLRIGKRCLIGYGAIITYGCSFIANDVIIGAGSVVTRDIREPNTIWAGNPAKKISDRK